MKTRFLLSAAKFLTQSSMITAFVIVTIVALDSDVRTRIKSQLTPKGKSLLSSIEGPLYKGKTTVRINKFKEAGKMYVEIFRVSHNDNSATQLDYHSQLQVPYDKDAYMSFDNVSTNLALADLDGDGVNEILVPGLLNGFSSGLIVFKYDSATNAFYQMNDHEMLISKAHKETKELVN